MKRFLSGVLCILLLATCLPGCGQEHQEGLGNGWEPVDSMKLLYAQGFSVDYYQEGYKLISIQNGDRFLVVPEGKEAPKGVARDIVPLYQPLDRIYLAATSAMCLFDALDRLDAIRLSGTRQEGWYVENAAQAMARGDILYAGKYSEPDYEMILDNHCDLAVESTMIGHASEVKQKLEGLRIPVLVDHSSMEPHPLGRSEWLRLYAALLNEEEKAERVFGEQVKHLTDLEGAEPTGKTVAFFHISSSGFVVARRTGDYVSKMIELAGGKYAFDNLGDPDKIGSTVTVEMETFYNTAKDADYVIYNSTIGGEIRSLEEFLGLSEVLKNFKAVKNGNVWCTSQNMFQESMKLGQMIGDFHEMLTDPDCTQLTYLYKLQ